MTSVISKTKREKNRQRLEKEVKDEIQIITPTCQNNEWAAHFKKLENLLLEILEESRSNQKWDLIVSIISFFLALIAMFIYTKIYVEPSKFKIFDFICNTLALMAVLVIICKLSQFLQPFLDKLRKYFDYVFAYLFIISASTRKVVRKRARRTFSKIAEICEIHQRFP